MSKIAIGFGLCVHSRSILANCTKCQDVCSDEALFVVENSIQFYSSKCTECLSCVSICPNMAISSTNGDIFGYVQNFLDDASVTIGSDTGFSPLGFDEQTILTMLALKKQDINIVVHDEVMAEKLKTKAISINAYASSMKINQISVSVQDEPTTQKDETTNDRRSFLKAFSGKNLISAAREINIKSQADDEPKVYDREAIDYDDIKVKKLPFVREAFLGVLENLQLASCDALAPIFSTDKHIDDSCTNCELCYNLCPTGALSTTRVKNSINFASYKCIKCALCEDVCESNSIHSLPTFELQNFAKKTNKQLIKFKVARCASCSSVFSPMSDDEYVCPRCAKEDEDAIELSGLF